MKIIGLITEYNPFHNGHEYHIKQALETTNADAAIVVMSGDFVQRGTPAIMPKHIRAKAALQAGASLVIELPVCYACASAEFFAYGAVATLHELGCVDAICFGSECGDIDKLKEIAAILADEPSDYSNRLQLYLKQGYSFPVSRSLALKDYTGSEDLSSILSSPNNTLGIEYLKAIYRLNSTMDATTILRKQSSYHDEELSSTYSSASAIRNHFSLDEQLNPDISRQMPEYFYDEIVKSYNKRFPVEANDFSLLLKYKLLTETKESLTKYADVTNDLANRIINKKNEFHSWNQFCDLLKTKELTYSRISRALLHILLEVPATREIPYARILGFRKDKNEIFSILKQHSKIPLVTKISQTSHLSESGVQMLQKNILCSDLYESIISNKFNQPFISEHKKQLCII